MEFQHFGDWGMKNEKFETALLQSVFKAILDYIEGLCLKKNQNK